MNQMSLMIQLLFCRRETWEVLLQIRIFPSEISRLRLPTCLQKKMLGSNMNIMYEIRQWYGNILLVYDVLPILHMRFLQLQDIPRGELYPCLEGKKPENKVKNRYVTIFSCKWNCILHSFISEIHIRICIVWEKK